MDETYVEWGSDSFDSFCGPGITYLYKHVSSGAIVRVERDQLLSFERKSKIVSYEEYLKMYDESHYGRVLDTVKCARLKKSLEDRRWQFIETKYGLNIEDILNNCDLLYFDTLDFIGIFPSRIFEIVRVLENNLDAVDDEKLKAKLTSLIKVFEFKFKKQLHGLALEDITKSRDEEFLAKYREMSNKLVFKVSESERLERLRELLIEENKNRKVISEAIISGLTSGQIINKTLLNFYDLDLVEGIPEENAKRIYPLYNGSNILECLLFELVQYRHYLEWQNSLKNVREDVIVSRFTLYLLNSVEELIESLIEIVKELKDKGLEFGLESADVTNPEKRLILSDSTIKIRNSWDWSFED